MMKSYEIVKRAALLGHLYVEALIHQGFYPLIATLELIKLHYKTPLKTVIFSPVSVAIGQSDDR